MDFSELALDVTFCVRARLERRFRPWQPRMTMMKKRLDQITAADIEQLVTDQVHEGRTRDYKRDLELSKDEHKRELAKDVSSFANAAGGDILFGVEEAKDANGKNAGYPEKIVGVNCPNYDDTKLRIESIIRDNIDPRIHGIGIHKVDGFENGPVIMIRVPRSWTAPHMVSFQNQSHFYSRNSAGKQPLDVREIRAAFLRGTEEATKIRRFRDERLGRMIAGDTPVPLDIKNEATVVVHLVPLGLDSESGIDVVALSKDPTKMRFPPGSPFYDRLNLDGYVRFTAPNKTPQYSYLQAFRSGAFEGVESMPIFRDKYPVPHFFGTLVEREVILMAVNGLDAIRGASISGPVSISVALLGANGVRIRLYGDSEHPSDREVTLDRDPLILPDVLIEGDSNDLRSALRPLFDALWQSSGWERSYGYDAAGVWDEAKHR